MKNLKGSAPNFAKEVTKHIRVTFFLVGGHSEWHIQADALEIVKMEWDMVIAFPPCTHLAVSGASWFDEKRKNGQQFMGIGFFLAFTTLNHVPRVAIENPIGIMSTQYRKPDQIIHPWQFGDNYEKSTCLWLKGLPLLKPIISEKPKLEYKEWTDKKTGKRKRENAWIMEARSLPPKERAMLRSKTFPGIAKAMAEQWGEAIDIKAEPDTGTAKDIWIQTTMF